MTLKFCQHYPGIENLGNSPQQDDTSTVNFSPEYQWQKRMGCDGKITKFGSEWLQHFFSNASLWSRIRPSRKKEKKKSGPETVNANKLSPWMSMTETNGVWWKNNKNSLRMNATFILKRDKLFFSGRMRTVLIWKSMSTTSIMYPISLRILICPPSPTNRFKEQKYNNHDYFHQTT